MECKRCGDCCRKGGPALHQEDKRLLDNGVIERKHLFTIRKGEMAWDHAKGVLKPVDREIVKIKGMGGEWTCRFWNPESGLCGIYSDRPSECRALSCWDTTELEAMYALDRLGREDLINTQGALWDILMEHEARCAMDQVKAAADAWRQGDEQAGHVLLEALVYDDAVRELLCEKAGAGPEDLDFLFGRSLASILVAFRIKARKWADGYKLVNIDADKGREGE